MALSTKQQAFVAHYLSCWNGAEAARRAGYSPRSAASIGSENLTKPEIAAAIQERLIDLKMSADEVLTRLTDHARGSIAPFLRVTPAGEVQGFDLNPDQPLHLVRKATVAHRTFKDETTEDTVTVELYDAQAALALLGKHHGLFTDKLDQTGSMTIRIVEDGDG